MENDEKYNFLKNTNFSKLKQKNEIPSEISDSFIDPGDITTERLNNSILDESNSYLKMLNNVNQNTETSAIKDIRQILMKFSDDTFLFYDILIIIECCPAISSYLIENSNKNKEIQVDLPTWISLTNMIEYLNYIKDESYLNFKCTTSKLLSIADYFSNQEIVTNLIKSDIIPNLINDDSILFLEYSYNKLSNNTENKAWFDLFYESIYSIAMNFPFYLSNHYDKIKAIKLEIIEEIIEK